MWYLKNLKNCGCFTRAIKKILKIHLGNLLQIAVFYFHHLQFIIRQTLRHLISEFWSHNKRRRWWWWWIVSVVWLIEKRQLALFWVETVVRDPHHRKSAIRGEQGLNLRRNFRLSWIKLSDSNNYYATSLKMVSASLGFPAAKEAMIITLFWHWKPQVFPSINK